MIPVTAPSAPSLEIESAAPGYAYGSYDGVLIANFRSELAAETLRSLLRYWDERLVPSARFRGLMYIAEEGFPLPSAEVRATGHAGFQNVARRPPAMALVIHGKSFGARALRKVGTALFSLRGGPPTRLFAEVGEAAAWIAERNEPALKLAGLVEACELLRKARG